MSREAYEAVQDHTKADHYGRNVLYALARFTPACGGEVRATLKTLSDLSGCDEDTVSNRVKWLQENGELTTRKEGAGRGTKVFYTILLPFDRPRYETSAGTTDESEVMTDKLSANKLDLMTEQIRLLTEQVRIMTEQIRLLTDGNKRTTDGTTDNDRRSVGTNTINTKDKHQEHQEEKTPPTPQGVRDGANFEAATLEDEFWGKAQILVNEWQDIIGDYRPLDANRKQDSTDFYAPALRMINDFGGDYAAAWQAVRAERERMIRDGLGNVRKLSAVVTGVLAGLERARLPELPPAHQGNGNGRKLSNAEVGAVEYAAIRNQFVRSKKT